MDAFKNTQTSTGGDLLEGFDSFDQGSPLQLQNWQGSSFEQQNSTPNFQKTFWGTGQIPLQTNNVPFQNNNDGRPPRQKPSNANRALQSAQNFPPNYYFPSSSMTDTPTERRVSSRAGKGTNSKFKENPAQQENVQPHKKGAKTPSPTSKPAAIATMAKPTDATPATNNSASKSQPESAANAKERMDKELEQSKKSDINKKKIELLEIMSTLRKELWIAQHNVAIHVKQKEKSIAGHKNTKASFAECMARLERTTTELKVAQEELKKVRAELVQAEKEKIQSKQELAAALKQIKAKPKGATKQGQLELNQALMAHIKVKTDNILYGMVKFIDDASDQSQAANLLVKYGDLPKEYVQTKEMKAQVAETYSDFIRKTLFLRRSYTTAEEKKWYEKRWKNNQQTLSLDDLIMCLQRNVKTQDDMEKFMIYWEEILPQQVGKTQWNKQVRYYTTISNAINQACTTHDISLITCEHEAFTVLSIHNHLDRWHNNHLNGVTEKEKDANNNGLFTSTKNGQNLFGGWSTEGMEKFNEYLDMNIAARNDPTKAHVEKDCLRLLRTKYNIEAENFGDHQKELARKKSAKKRGKPDLPMPPMKKIVRTMRFNAFSDDEDQDQEGNNSVDESD